MHLVLDATRPTHITGLGAYGSGFLNNPAEIVGRIKRGGAAIVS